MNSSSRAESLILSPLNSLSSRHLFCSFASVLLYPLPPCLASPPLGLPSSASSSSPLSVTSGALILGLCTHKRQGACKKSLSCRLVWWDLCCAAYSTRQASTEQAATVPSNLPFLPPLLERASTPPYPHNLPSDQELLAVAVVDKPSRVHCRVLSWVALLRHPAPSCMLPGLSPSLRRVGPSASVSFNASFLVSLFIPSSSPAQSPTLCTRAHPVLSLA